ncbi:hypothetical protein WN55_03811 [Dufourea novaeangliae]|uniref:Reverse transcriptase domain-containing protein n=1 Tax=Dufourea novaeangliae TaxID=178035 RepID=A0A154PIW1_DUFNO|nr:hypothetical protein WN55_03811 [Dufourea novaeangliae]
MRVVCYADDTLIIAVGMEWTRTIRLAEVGAAPVVALIQDLGLQISPPKTEVVMFHGLPLSRRVPQASVRVGDACVRVGGRMKYALSSSVSGCEDTPLEGTRERNSPEAKGRRSAWVWEGEYESQSTNHKTNLLFVGDAVDTSLKNCKLQANVCNLSRRDASHRVSKLGGRCERVPETLLEKLNGPSSPCRWRWSTRREQRWFFWKHRNKMTGKLNININMELSFTSTKLSTQPIGIFCTARRACRLSLEMDLDPRTLSRESRPGADTLMGPIGTVIVAPPQLKSGSGELNSNMAYHVSGSVYDATMPFVSYPRSGDCVRHMAVNHPLFGNGGEC